MRFSTVAASAAIAAGAYAHGMEGHADFHAPSNGTGPVFVTEVLTAFTTFCPEPTSIVHNGQTYTVTEATTLTISDCPCTVSYPVSSAVVSSCATCTAEISVPAVPVTSEVASSPVPVPTSEAPVVSSSIAVPNSPAPVPTSQVPVVSGSVVPIPVPSSAAPYPTYPANGTAPVGTAPAGTAPVGTGSATATAPLASFTGAASRAVVGAGAGVAAFFGLVAYAL